MLRIRRPLVRIDVVACDAFLLAIIVNLFEGWGERGQLGVVEHEFLVAAGRVYKPQLSTLALIVALNEGKFGAVRAPFDGFRGTAGDAARGEDRFDGERCRGRARLCESGGRKKKYEGDAQASAH